MTISNLREREEGFTLIELLVVIIIIGILAAIAIPTFLNQREKGWDAAAKSALKNAAIAQESYFTEEDTYTDNAADELEDEGWNPTANVLLDVVTADTDGFCMTAAHDNSDTDWELDSDVGEIVEGDCLP